MPRTLCTLIYSLIYSWIKWLCLRLFYAKLCVKSFKCKGLHSYLTLIISSLPPMVYSVPLILANSQPSAFITSVWTLCCQPSLSYCGLFQEDFYPPSHFCSARSLCWYNIYMYVFLNFICTHTHIFKNLYTHTYKPSSAFWNWAMFHWASSIILFRYIFI